MAAWWLPLLFRGEGRHVLAPIQAPLPGSDLPNYHPPRETFNKGWLVPSAGSPASISSVSELELCIFLPPHTGSFCFLLTPSPHSPSLSSLSTHSIIFTEEDLSRGFYCQPMLSWHEKLIKKETTSSSEGIEDCSHILSFMRDQKLPEKHKS